MTKYTTGPRPSSSRALFNRVAAVILVAVTAVAIGAVIKTAVNSGGPSYDGTWYSQTTGSVLQKSGDHGKLYWRGPNCGSVADTNKCLDFANVKFIDNAHGIITGAYGLDENNKPVMLNSYSQLNAPFFTGVKIVLSPIAGYPDAINMQPPNADAARLCRVLNDTFCS